MGDGARGAPPALTLRRVYERLYEAYGPQGWWPGDGPFEVIVGAILTQSAAWGNVEKALDNLKAAGVLSPERLSDIGESELARLIRPAGYYNAKARKLKAFAALLGDEYGGDLASMLAEPAESLRERLLATHGIGPETADCILLYAAARPAFVVDAYTRRLFARIGLRPQRDTYDCWQRLFESSLEPEAALYNEYHALIVRHGKEICRREPLCRICPLVDACETGAGYRLQRRGSRTRLL